MSNQLHKLKIDLLKVTGARKFTAKDGSEHVAIPATSLYMGKGAYLDLDMRGNREGEDQYGNTHFIAISPTKEQRMAKEKTPIIGNAKTLTFGDTPQQPQRQQTAAAPKPSSDAFDDEVDDLPF
jgi:hypothetical protein